MLSRYFGAYYNSVKLSNYSHIVSQTFQHFINIKIMESILLSAVSQAVSDKYRMISPISGT